MTRYAIIGASGAIGSAFTQHLLQRADTTHIYTFSRHSIPASDARIIPIMLDMHEEETVRAATSRIMAEGSLDAVLVATGILHEGEITPEKSLRDITAEKMAHIYDVNTIIPALAMKHFLPCLHKEQRTVFAALSARVGSISDNQLGGWYAYRASKAALNMLIKNASIEMARRYKHAIVVGLHPGTVDSPLSKPFQAHVAADHLFTAEYAATQLLQVIAGLHPYDSGKCFAYDGQEILP